MDNRKKVLVTGATGMLGARLVFDLLSQGVKVRAIYRNPKRIEQFAKNVSFYCENSEELNSLVEWVKADVLDYESMCEAVRGVDMVFHLAAMVSFYPADYYTMCDININGTSNVVDACIANQVKRLFHVSSIAALGENENGGEISEETKWIPGLKRSGYQISKFQSEMQVSRGASEGLETVIVNPSVILGAGEWHTGSPAFFQNIYKGMGFYPGGGTGFVDVVDVSKAIVLLADNENWDKAKGDRYLLNAENLSYKNAFAMIANSMSVKAPQKLATTFLLGVAWRAAWVAGKVTRKKPLITRGSVANSSVMQLFNGRKITQMFDFEYTPMQTTINRIGKSYLDDN